MSPSRRSPTRHPRRGHTLRQSVRAPLTPPRQRSPSPGHAFRACRRGQLSTQTSPTPFASCAPLPCHGRPPPRHHYAHSRRKRASSRTRRSGTWAWARAPALQTEGAAGALERGLGDAELFGGMHQRDLGEAGQNRAGGVTDRRGAGQSHEAASIKEGKTPLLLECNPTYRYQCVLSGLPISTHERLRLTMVSPGVALPNALLACPPLYKDFIARLIECFIEGLAVPPVSHARKGRRC
jgi:hypothetical protein